MTETSEVRAETLLKELAGVWKDLGKAQPESAVLRACSLTLLVATRGQGDEIELSNTLGDLIHSHPGRYITLRLIEDAEPQFSARAFAQCQLAFGRRQQICCEQIEFTATMDRIPDFYAVALGLTVADLPVLLWMKDATLLLEQRFRALLVLARPLILDSVQLPDASHALSELLALRHAGWRIKDLAWTRLTVWRETVAQLFESVACRHFCEEVRRIDVSTTRERHVTENFYLAAWLSHRIPQASVTVSAGSMDRLRFESGERFLEITLEGELLSATGLDGIWTRVQRPPSTDSALLTEELGILGPDPTYDTTLAEAERFARSGNQP